ncbi:hypothetical protein SAMN06314042_11318 [Epsilonproteobacteria bacterium SCGC AD-308-O04]|jgi:uncharacterized protein|nr:hypothetical protein SAMN06314042_11318 [Epsilonproteobacteria bacterium SCGC AD-308-O04]
MIDTVLLRIAKSAILSQFDKNYVLKREELTDKYPFLDKNGAAFVTLKYDHQLRGCIGSIIAHGKLLDDVIHNAKSAAFGDPRFHPLKNDEFPHLTLEVSVLTAPEILEYTDFDDLAKKIQPNIDGLILKHGAYQGTFLPQVWEELPLPKDFLEHLSMKAGSNPSIYNEQPTIYRYRVEAVEDDFDKILVL